MSRASSRGVTLMEMVAVLVVAGIAIPVLLTMWSTISWQAVRSEGVSDASFYAQGLMEEVLSKSYDQNEAEPWSRNLGVDSGENAGNASTFNDVDDYVNATDPRITAPAPSYRRRARVEYVILNSTNTWQACASVNCQDTTTCATCNECCYKRITVNVWRTDRVPTNVSMATIVAAY
ncbi:MAG: prepilin-type N-terminal cleavage/methylation domain-containing protein [Candidatus Omnitrophica bacterium]|nr:prepilin-type N-terminal cleavage/methylation domain-containing protein [Candidatus Omnitrophota bacterium]